MKDKCDTLLIDRDFSEISDILFFIDPKYISFWISNKDFRMEYKRLISCGMKDGFYLFYLTAHNIDAEMRDVASTGSGFDFDFATSHKSIEAMEHRLRNGYDDRNSDPRLNFLINRLSAPAMSFRYWLMVPEFVAKVQELLPTDVKLNNASVYPILVSVYKSKVDKKNNSDTPVPFNSSIARKAIQSIEKKLKIPQENRLKNTVHHQ